MSLLSEYSDIFEVLLATISEGIIIVDGQQMIVATNPALDHIFGYDPGELCNKPLSLLIPEYFHQAHQQKASDYFQHPQSRKMAQGKGLFGMHKKGVQIALEVGLYPIENLNKIYVMGLVSDITQRYMKEREIERINESLESRIRLRTDKLLSTIAQLRKEISIRKEAEIRIREHLDKEKELNQLKSSFLSMVSHEFKTPLSNILTSCELVEKYDQTTHQNKRIKHLNTIKHQVQHLTLLLNDFLSTERLAEGKENYQHSRFSVQSVLNEVIYEANINLKPGQEIRFPTEAERLYIHQDERIFELILTNLIQNAIKYSPENSTITLKLGLLDQPDRIWISVQDEGIGIPEKEQKHLFTKYFRASNVQNIQGTGMGLYLIQTHLRNLGGLISVKSSSESGTYVYVELPNHKDHD